MSIEIDLVALKAAAEAAGSDVWTSDAWDVGASGTFYGSHVWRARGDAVARCFVGLGSLPRPIDDSQAAEFIAMANPAVVLALIERLEMVASIERRRIEKMHAEAQTSK